MKPLSKWGCFLGLILVGCTPLLYQPSRVLLTGPKKLKVQPPEEVHFTSLDGTPLHGWYFHNKILRQPKGTIVYFHGNAENISTHFAGFYWILEYGYDYFIFDYHGFGKSEGKPSPKATVEDGVAAICWAYQHQPNVALILFGQSLGGAVLLRSVAEVKDQIPIAYVVVDSTFHSYKAAARSALSRSFLTWPLQWLGLVLISDRYAPKKQIAQLPPISLLVLHGDNDETVPVRLGEKVYQLANEPKEFIKIPGGVHTDAFHRHEGKYRQALLQRLDRITKTSSPPRRNKHYIVPRCTVPARN